MTQKQNRQAFFVLLLVLAVATVLWACNGAAPSTTVSATPVPATLAVTETPSAVATEAAAALVITPTSAAAVTRAETTSAQGATNAQALTFTLDQSQSEARFTLDEELLGAPKTVVGTTSAVSGTITLDPTDMAKTTLGAIRIDAQSFTTDSGMRNNAIRRFILQSNNEQNRYIVFTPTAIEGLPSTAKAGDTFDLTIAGNLTISGVTKPVTFTATVKADSANQLSGLAKTQVLRSDFNLTIPNVPSVANVTDAVQLELQFVATTQVSA